ncbi:ARPC1A [Symbiodinium microadriaticum]|nr:ARPC1A [Symbiodinium microadriaticum]
MVKKKFKSTVLCCAFHPQNGQLLATGSADFKCRVFSTFDSTVDAAPSQGNFEKPLEFGEAYCEFSSHGWVTGVAWSPSGESLCYAGHDSSISVVTFSPGGRSVSQTIRFRDLPLTCVTFVSERAIVGAGHDFNPMVFTSSGGQGLGNRPA